MEDNRSEDRLDGQWEDRAPSATTRWLVILCVVLFGAAVFAGGYAIQQNAAVAELKQQNQTMNAAEQQLRGEIDAISTKLAKITAPPPPATPAATDQSSTSATATTKSAPKRATFTAQDRRFKQMQTQLTEQQKELKQTQSDLASARSDLEGQLGSTRDELSGSIAKTHDELVSLEKRGERLYYEFDLSKSKSFEREGPIQVSLRKADAKHQSYDLMMLVDDHQLSKKKVDLYEPIWLHQGDMPQPVQVVVNRIDKDHVHGYVSAPRYRESELAANAPQQPAADSKSNYSPASTSPSKNSSTSTSPSATSSQGQQKPVD